MEGWQKLLLAAGGAAGVAAFLYYLLRDETEAESSANEDADGAREVAKKPGEMSKQDVLVLLEEIVNMQSSMKANMKELTKEIAASSLEFEQIYTRCKEVQPSDPCEKHGLKPEDLDRVLQSYSSDPEVNQAITKIMGAPEPQGPGNSAKPLKDIPLATLVDVHVFMLQELKGFVSTFEAIPDKAKYDMKTVGIATQATLDAKVTKKFSITSEDMEGAILLHKSELVGDMKFLQTHMEFQKVMTDFLGPSMMQ